MNSAIFAGYAPGGYRNRCRSCRAEFAGDKRATSCSVCALAVAVGRFDELEAENAALREYMESHQESVRKLDFLLNGKHRAKHAELPELLEQVDQLRKDAARLDWILDNCCISEAVGLGEYVPLENNREFIDAAMREGESK